MRKETVTCEKLFTGEEETVDLYFHLTEAELTLLNIASNEKYSSYKENDPRYTNEQNVKLFTKLISTAYGQKTENGQFIKNDEIRDTFLCSPAFSAFLSKFISGEIKVDEFVLDCLPRSVSKRMKIVNGKPVIE